MKLMGLAVAMAMAGAVTLGAQETKVKSETKVKVEDGKAMTLTGCLAGGENGTGYSLTDIGGGHGATAYILVGGDRGDLKKHVGHRVEIKGNIANGDHGKVEVKSKTKVDHDAGPGKTRKSEITMKGDALSDLPYFGVKSVKMVGASCR